ncbi:MAG: hypothetical protein AAF411_07595 [Myxococcota bacterium]
MRAFAFAPIALCLACGSAASAPEAPRSVQSEVYVPPATNGEIERSTLSYVVDRGLANFLRGVRVQPHLNGDEFVGHRIVSMYPDDPRFTALPIQPGDTVTRVNGQSIERPEQAYEVWSGLRVSSELVIDYLSGGQAHQLRFAIVD